MKAKAASAATAWWSTKVAFQVMLRATIRGLPAAVRASMPLNPLAPGVNMNGCSWRTPSRSQIVASASWSARRASGVAERVLAPVPPWVGTRAGSLAVIPGQPSLFPGFCARYCLALMTWPLGERTYQ